MMETIQESKIGFNKDTDTLKKTQPKRKIKLKNSNNEKETHRIN